MANVKILVVDDEKVFCLAVKKELERQGYEVETALCGEEAVRAIEEDGFSLVYVDLIMPRMNGVDICRKIKEISPGLQVVLISGHPNEVEKKKPDFVRAGGSRSHLSKPLHEGELARVTESLLKRRTNAGKKDHGR